MDSLYIAWYPTKPELDDQFISYAEPRALGGSVQDIEVNSVSQGLGICHQLNDETAKQSGHYCLYRGEKVPNIGS